MTRPMTTRLAAALDALSPSDRRVLKRLATESESGLLGGLLAGIRSELIADEIRESEVLAGLAADHQAEVEALCAAADWPDRVPPAPRTESWWPLGESDTQAET
jgi:hypothetical protein